MVYKSLNGLAPDYLKSMFTNRSAISTYSLRNCERQTSCPTPPHQFSKNQFQLQWCVALEQLTLLSICGKHNLLLVLNPAAGVSSLIMIKLINSNGIHGKQALYFVIVSIFLLLLNLI